MHELHDGNKVYQTLEHLGVKAFLHVRCGPEFTQEAFEMYGFLIPGSTVEMFAEYDWVIITYDQDNLDETCGVKTIACMGYNAFKDGRRFFTLRKFRPSTDDRLTTAFLDLIAEFAQRIVHNDSDIMASVLRGGMEFDIVLPRARNSVPCSDALVYAQAMFLPPGNRGTPDYQPYLTDMSTEDAFVRHVFIEPLSPREGRGFF
jgi:hypothetical protein